MLELTSAGQPVQLSVGTSVALEQNSPLFDEDTILGSFSYAFSIPALPNGPLYQFPERPDGAGMPGALLPAELTEDGLLLLSGSQRIKSANPAKYAISLQAGLSGANLSARQLSSFAYGGLREVPRWVSLDLNGSGSVVAVPGLVKHAGEVVARPEGYDYVFAPLRNEYVADTKTALGTVEPLDYPALTVNKWFYNSYALLGMAAGGTFTYNIDFTVPGAATVQAYELLPPYCPFPRLRYVLQAVCEEAGLAVDLPNLLPGELGDLVLAGNAQLVDRGDADVLRFSLADVLPALTVAELLAAIRQDLGIVLYVDQVSQRVRTAYLVERVAADAAYVDLTERLAGYPEATIDDATGLTLTYHVDSDDALTKDLLSQQPDPALLLPAVATYLELPKTAVLRDNPLAGQVRLVEDEDTYYTCALSYLDPLTVLLTWSVLVVNLPAVSVLGGGDEQAQAIVYTKFLPTRVVGGDGLSVASLPAISQPPYRADQTVVARSASLRLLFYNGLQLVSDGLSRYPQLSAHSKSGTYSVKLSGPQGTYEQLLKDWLPVKLSPVSYKQPLLLTTLDLARLDLTQPLRLDGVRYLVRKLSATVPLRKVATLELIHL